MVNNHPMQLSNNFIPYFRILALCIIIFESNGLVSRFLGFSAVTGAWLYAFVMVVCLGLALLEMIMSKEGKELNVFFYPLVLFSIFIFVSFVSASILFPKPIKDWLPSLYKFTPLFIFYFLYVFKYTSKEIIFSIIIVSISASLLLLVDHFNPLEFLNSYMRRSAFFSLEGRRIVILKNEVILGFVAIVSFIISSKNNLINNKLLLVSAAFLFLIQAFIMESRMGFLAMGVAVITLLYLKGVTQKTLQLSIAALLVVFLAFPVIFSSHIDSLQNMSMDDSESNISIRFETVEYFYQTFKESYGLGIGMMSSNSHSYNVLHMAEHYNILDAGFFSALFQFGPLGLLAWGFLTLKCLHVFKRYYVFTGKSDPVPATIFAFLIAFTFSPLPISFFTSSWCISVGGIFLYMTWFYEMKLLTVKSHGAVSNYV